MNTTILNQHSVKELREKIKSIEKIISILDKKKIFGQENRENYFFENHNDIMGNYPFLVSQLCSNSDNDMLEIMLRHIEEIELGEKSKDEAELIIGDKLVNNYVKKN